MTGPGQNLFRRGDEKKIIAHGYKYNHVCCSNAANTIYKNKKNVVYLLETYNFSIYSETDGSMVVAYDKGFLFGLGLSIIFLFIPFVWKSIPQHFASAGLVSGLSIIALAFLPNTWSPPTLSSICYVSAITLAVFGYSYQSSASASGTSKAVASMSPHSDSHQSSGATQQEMIVAEITIMRSDIHELKSYKERIDSSLASYARDWDRWLANQQFHRKQGYAMVPSMYYGPMCELVLSNYKTLPPPQLLTAEPIFQDTTGNGMTKVYVASENHDFIASRNCNMAVLDKWSKSVSSLINSAESDITNLQKQLLVLKSSD